MGTRNGRAEPEGDEPLTIVSDVGPFALMPAWVLTKLAKSPDAIAVYLLIQVEPPVQRDLLVTALAKRMHVSEYRVSVALTTLVGIGALNVYESAYEVRVTNPATIERLEATA